VNLNFNSSLCGCKRAPRVIWERYAICACEHLVHAPSRAIGPMTPWDTWVASINPQMRVRLINYAKERCGLPLLVDPDTVRDALAAARDVKANQLADDLEYEQWVASL
jgi:hypothetical protein